MLVQKYVIRKMVLFRFLLFVAALVRCKYNDTRRHTYTHVLITTIMIITIIIMACIFLLKTVPTGKILQCVQ